MLIQFSVENFRSIRDEQILSLVRSSSLELVDNYFSTEAPNTPELLKSAVIYGANASGKSNLLKALHTMKLVIAQSFTKDINSPIIYEPFLFNKENRQSPTTFEIAFILQNFEGQGKPVRALYGFSADQNYVHEEWFSVFPKGREQTWFHRILEADSGEYSWTMSSMFKGEKESWKKQTRSDQLFFSTAAHLNSPQIKAIYEELIHALFFLHDTSIVPSNLSSQFLSSDEEKKILIDLFNASDIPIEDIEEESHPVQSGEGLFIHNLMSKEMTTRGVDPSAVKPTRVERYFVYRDENGEKVRIKFQEESDGTQKLFSLAGVILLALKFGKTLVVDELNKSHHSDLVRFLVSLFNSSMNKNNAQLIFTSHETSILRKDLLRRDQIWFCEKQVDRSTRLYPLTDFKPHVKREDLEEYYLHGRYGAKPKLGAFILPNDFMS